jgi:lysophospholipase L1-like esterase
MCKILFPMKNISLSQKKLIILTTIMLIASWLSILGTFAKAESAPYQKANNMDKKLIILGASYAEGWDAKNLGSYIVINKGVGGQVTKQMLDRMDEDVILLHPDAVILWGFINNIFRSPRDKMENTIEGIKNDYLLMIDMAHKNNIEPILATEVTIRHKDTIKDSILNIVGYLLGKESYQDYINMNVTAVNDWIQDLAKKEKLRLLDIHAITSTKDGVRKKGFATTDGSHITKEAYKEITDYTTKKFNQR